MRTPNRRYIKADRVPAVSFEGFGTRRNAEWVPGTETTWTQPGRHILTLLARQVIVPRECVGDRHKAVHDSNLFDINAKNGDVVEVERVYEYFAQL